MKDKLKKMQTQAIEAIKKSKGLKELEKVHLKYFGRKAGALNTVLKGLKDLSVEQKKEIGQLANQIKTTIEQEIDKRNKEIADEEIIQKVDKEWVDITLPGNKKDIGSLHPITQIQYEIEDIFTSMGFNVFDGPEIESDFYNFQAANIPPDHPARDMQDTFWLEDNNILRTHTTASQVRAMEMYGAPLRVIVPGRVFRYENTDASHENTFNQIEGLMVDKEISMANLISVMKTLVEGVLKREVKIRVRPGFFAFVEPGIEMDINCEICDGAGCKVCKNTGWLELLPAGLVHPNVLKAGGVDPGKYMGFAFGLGLDRLVMMKYGIEDIRHFNSGDLRFLKQF